MPPTSKWISSRSFRYKQHLPEAYQLENPSGIKVWFGRQSNGKWICSIGDENEFELPGDFNIDTVKRVMLLRTVGYLEALSKHLKWLHHQLSDQ